MFFLLPLRQQGFGVVCVALASQGVTLMTGLLEDVKVEGRTPPRPPEPARLDPLETYTATERLARLFSAVPLNQLLFYLATVAYRKVKFPSCELLTSSCTLSLSHGFQRVCRLMVMCMLSLFFNP